MLVTTPALWLHVLVHLHQKRIHGKHTQCHIVQKYCSVLVAKGQSDNNYCENTDACIHIWRAEASQPSYSNEPNYLNGIATHTVMFYTCSNCTSTMQLDCSHLPPMLSISIVQILINKMYNIPVIVLIT